ncbi:MAG: hypothetical protein WC607_02395 [Candidatus Micrarchaeia archaeon]
MTPRIRPMNREHPDYEDFQDAVKNLSHSTWDERYSAVNVLSAIGHPEAITHLAVQKQGLRDEEIMIREQSFRAIVKIVDAINASQPKHPALKIALEHLFKPGQGINDPSVWVRERNAKSLGKIADVIKASRPDHPAVIAVTHINPEQHPKAFIALYEALAKGEHLGQPPAWLTTTAKQLKALEGNLK